MSIVKKFGVMARGSDLRKEYISATLFRQLVAKVNQCAGDGVFCDQCPVLRQCRGIWDTHCCVRLHRRCYECCDRLLDEMREKKWAILRRKRVFYDTRYCTHNKKTATGN